MTALLVLMLAATLPAGARVSPRVKPTKSDGAVLAPNKPSEGPGQVTYVTSDSVFVDRGSIDGVAIGTSLTVTRAGKTVGACTVSSVTEQAATCVGPSIQPGDRIGVARKPPPKSTPLAALPDTKELASRLKAVEGTPTPLVDFEGAPSVAGGSGAATVFSLVISQSTYANFAGSGGPYQLQRADVQLRDIRIWKGLRASADVSVLNWSQRPLGFANPNKSGPELFVRQLQLEWRDPGGRFDVSAGRVWLKHVPGLGVVDGAQGGLRTSSGALEGGVFGGLIPNALTLAPQGSQWTVGAWGNAHYSKGSGADAFFIEPEARLNWANRDVGGRFEVGAALHTWVGRFFDAHALAQMGLVTAVAPGGLDFARVDIGVHPTERVQISLGGRYRGNPSGDAISLEVGAPTPGARGVNADAAVMMALSSFTLGVQGMVAHDLDSSLTQASFGAQVQLPTLLGRLGVIALGFNDEVGWLAGRSAWAQLTLTPHWRFRVVARFNWFMQDATAATLGIAGHELGAYLAFDVHFTSFLWLRLSALGRQALSATQGSQSDLPGPNPWRAGISGTAALGVDL